MQPIPQHSGHCSASDCSPTPTEDAYHTYVDYYPAPNDWDWSMYVTSMPWPDGQRIMSVDIAIPDGPSMTDQIVYATERGVLPADVLEDSRYNVAAYETSRAAHRVGNCELIRLRSASLTSFMPGGYIDWSPLLGMFHVVPWPEENDVPANC